MRRESLIGQSVPRVEDARLLAGRGAYVDDIPIPGMVHMAVLRSPEAHGRIVQLDLSAARLLPGVIDVFAAADWPGEVPLIPLRLMPLASSAPYLQPVLARDRVRYVGEPVAVVVARDRYLAEDALAAIELDIEPLPPVVSMDDAEAATGAALAFPEAGSNVSARYSVARGDVEAGFAAAAYRRRETFRSHRQLAAPIETRGCIVRFDRGSNTVTMWGASKVIFFNRRHLARTFGLAEDRVQLIGSDIGGSFGVRGELYPEDYLTIEASRRTGRPVKWIEDRREHFAATNHSRDVECDMEIAADAAGRVLAMRCRLRADMGAYVRTNGNVVPVKCAQFLPGPYAIGNVACEVVALMTNKTPVGTYRGPGRVEANFFRERMLDLMATDLGLDPAEVRLRNLVPTEAMPYDIGCLLPIGGAHALDSGDYPGDFRKFLDEIDYAAWPARQGRFEDGRLHGLGLACFNESSGGGNFEIARLRIDPAGRAIVSTGGSSMGQGIETGLAQLTADALDLGLERIEVLQAATTHQSDGVGSFHSRSTLMGGSAIFKAGAALLDEARVFAALRLNDAAERLTYADGWFAAADAPERRISLWEIAAGRDGGLDVEARFEQEPLSFSFGAHAAHVAVDPGTGKFEVLRYWVVEDVGRVINPALVEAQTVGGVVQGLGGATLDRLVYDAQGQLLTQSFADYLVPTSTEAPPITALAFGAHPSPHNPLGVKGAGEGGIVAAAAALGNALAQALGPGIGAGILSTPFTPETVFRLLDEAQPAGSEERAPCS